MVSIWSDHYIGRTQTLWQKHARPVRVREILGHGQEGPHRAARGRCRSRKGKTAMHGRRSGQHHAVQTSCRRNRVLWLQRRGPAGNRGIGRKDARGSRVHRPIAWPRRRPHERPAVRRLSDRARRHGEKKQLLRAGHPPREKGSGGRVIRHFRIRPVGGQGTFLPLP